MYQQNRIIVIGGNAAGPSAAAKAKRVNPDADVILFEAGDFISTGTCELPYLFSGEIKNHNDLIFFSHEDFFVKKGVKVYTNHLVTKIDARRREIIVLNKKTDSVEEYEYDKLVLTTGSSAKEIYNLPYSLENVFKLKTISDYIKIDNYLKSEKVYKILIVGSGYIGLEIADSLKKVGYTVTLLEKEDLPMPSSDEEVQYLIKDILEKNNIELLNGNNQSNFILKNNKLSQLKCDGRYIDFDMAIVAIGVEPNNQLGIDAKLKVGYSGGLIVDSRLKTSDPHIYAAGDNIEVVNKITRKGDYIPLATHAHAFGHIAGENSAGGNRIVNDVVFNSTFFFCGNFIANVGLSQKAAEEFSINTKYVTAVANNKVKIMPNSSKVFGKILFDKKTKLILGASFVGNQEISGYADIISSFIYNKIPAESLGNINYNYTPPLSPFVNILSILGRKIKESY